MNTLCIGISNRSKLIIGENWIMVFALVRE
jgi:hypothetical protein